MALQFKRAAQDSPTLLDLDEDIIPFITSDRFKQPDPLLFISFYTPWIKNPYSFDFFIWRDYHAFIFPSSCYVLNTFSRLDPDRLIALYIEHLRPCGLDQYRKIVYFISHLHLYTPSFYQKDIESIIKTTKPRIF